jgi:hypothetical protein
VYAVAVTELVTPLDVEAQALARDLGVTPYEARLELAGGFPAVILTTPDRARAQQQLDAIRARRHGAVAFDMDAVVSSADMIGMRRFRFEPDAVTTDDAPGEHLPYDDVFLMVRAVHKSESVTRSEQTQRKFNAVRAIASGGLLMTTKKTTETVKVTGTRDQVVYFFRRSGSAPWILRENGTHWNGLGPALAPTQMENFQLTIKALRERMPTAGFDERLLAMKRERERGGKAGQLGESSQSGWIDLLAHALALSLYGRFNDPYRT